MPVEVEKCQDKVECFNADLKADWERWQSNKRQDFKQLLTGMADKNINHYEKVCEAAVGTHGTDLKKVPGAGVDLESLRGDLIDL